MSFSVVESINVRDLYGEQRCLQFCVGDVTDTSDGERVDLLGISAFANDYSTFTPTVISSLLGVGISVEKEASRKIADWRDSWQCWFSDEIEANLLIRRLVCFEHESISAPESVVSNFFRSIREFVLGSPINRLGLLRVPILSTGDQQADQKSMVHAIVREAFLSLKLGLPVDRIQIVFYERSATLHRLLFHAGRQLALMQQEWIEHFDKSINVAQYDLFVSYRHRQRDLVINPLIEQLKRLKPDLRICIDHEILEPGVFWKPELMRGLVNSKHSLCIITHDYPTSPECMDEFHAALCLARYRSRYLIPISIVEPNRRQSRPATLDRIHYLDGCCPPREIEQVAKDVIASLD